MTSPRQVVRARPTIPRQVACGRPPALRQVVRAGPPAPRRFDIELLRVVAVVGVVLFHFAPGGTSLVPNGYLGVDVFFTVSGFVITAQMLRSRDAGRLTYPDFLARRVRRLLPAAVLVIVVTYVAVLLSRNVIAIESQSSVAIAALLYVSNVVFARQSVDYFASTDAPSPFLHYWSLSVEEQFYLVWPLVVIALAFAVRRRPDLFRRRLLLVALAGTGLSLLAAAWWMRVAPEQAFFLPWARAHQLLIGAAAAIVLAGSPGWAARVPGAVLATLRVAAIGWLVALLVLPFGNLASPGPIALLVSVPVAFVALTGTGSDLLSRIGGRWPLAWTARLSYVAYLWHWPVWVLVLDRFGGLRAREKIVLALVATLVLSVATHLFVEQPVRDGRRLRSLPPRRTVALGLVASVLAAATVLGAAAFAPARPWQQDVRPAIAGLGRDMPDVYARNCQSTSNATTVKICADGDLGSPVTVMGLGDSHTATWQPAMQALARSGGHRYLSATKAQCYLWDTPSGSVHQPFTGCDRWRANAFARAVRDRPDVVVLHSRVPWTVLRTDTGTAITDPARRAAALTVAVTSTVREARRSGATVVAMLDIPRATGAVPVQTCLATADRPEACDFPSASGSQERAVFRKAARAAGAVVVDPYPLICPGATCRPVQGEVVAYRDDGHLTRTYVLQNLPWVRSWLAPLLPR